MATKANLLSFYLTYWDSPKFRKGYDTPFCSRLEAQPYLDRAAEVVVFIWNDLRLSYAEIEALGVGGCSREYLWSCQHSPKDNPAGFIRAIVHASLRDANHNYVRNLTVQNIDSLIEKAGGTHRARHTQSSTTEDDTSLGNARDVVVSQFVALQSEVDSFKTMAEASDCDRCLDPKQQAQLLKVETYLESARIHLSNLITSIRAMTDTESSSECVRSDIFPLLPVHVAKKASEKAKDQEQPEQQQQQQRQPEPEPQVEQQSEQQANEQEGVVKVQKVASHVQDVGESIKQITSQLESTPQALGTDSVRDLKQKLRRLNESLMMDLFALDAVSLPENSSEARQCRKQQVKAVQGLMGVLDEMDKKIVDLLKHTEEEERLRKQQQPQQPQQHDQEQQQQQPQQQQQEQQQQHEQQETQQEHHQSNNKRPREEGVDDINMSSLSHASPPTTVELLTSQEAYQRLWPQLKLEPQFQFSRARDSYVISSMIPGMNAEDVSIEINGNLLVLVGVRVPTKEEVITLAQMLRQRLSPQQIAKLTPGLEAQLITKMGFGTFGSFRQTFQIPKDGDGDSVSASYRGGLLKIEIPKLRISARPHPLGDRHQDWNKPEFEGFPALFRNPDLFWI